jgi:hypothetical protein
MTKHLFKSLMAAGLVAALALVSVPVGAAEVTARIPFSFTVNGKTLPAGGYQFATSQSALLVRGFTGGAVVVTNRLESRKDFQPKAVFHKYGDRYILSEVWLGGGAGRDIPEGRRSERDAATFERVVIPLT